MSRPGESNSPASDELPPEVLAQVARGDRDAFNQCYARLSGPVYGIAYAILRDPTEAEDLAHDVFVSLWEKAGDYDGRRGSPIAWVLTIARNRSIDRLRNRKRRGELLDASVPGDLGYDTRPPMPNAAQDAERADAVRHALQDLPAEQRLTLELAYFRGLSQQEIADRTATPLGTVKARMRRAMLKMRDMLVPHQ